MVLQVATVEKLSVSVSAAQPGGTVPLKHSASACNETESVCRIEARLAHLRLVILHHLRLLRGRVRLHHRVHHTDSECAACRPIASSSTSWTFSDNIYRGVQFPLHRRERD